MDKPTPLLTSRPQFSYPFLCECLSCVVCGGGELAFTDCVDWYQLDFMLSLRAQLPASTPATLRKGL